MPINISIDIDKYQYGNEKDYAINTRRNGKSFRK
jgi:hypothetical protein